MKRPPQHRDDFSMFLVHLTKDSEKETAHNNLIRILKRKRISARNPYCLFKYRLEHFKHSLASKFNTVCFTEAPLPQIKHLVSSIPGREIELKPYGLVFWKDSLLDRGVSPAIYLNSSGTDISKLLLNQFDDIFDDVQSFRDLQNKVEDATSLIQYYSLVNKIGDNYSFAWEREWRHTGSFSFDYIDLAVIIAEHPDHFLESCRKQLAREKSSQINRIPIISPEWNYEQVIHEMSVKLWDLEDGKL